MVKTSHQNKTKPRKILMIVVLQNKMNYRNTALQTYSLSCENTCKQSTTLTQSLFCEVKGQLMEKLDSRKHSLFGTAIFF